MACGKHPGWFATLDRGQQIAVLAHHRARQPTASATPPPPTRKGLYAR